MRELSLPGSPFRRLFLPGSSSWRWLCPAHAQNPALAVLQGGSWAVKCLVQRGLCFPGPYTPESFYSHPVWSLNVHSPSWVPPTGRACVARSVGVSLEGNTLSRGGEAAAPSVWGLEALVLAIMISPHVFLAALKLLQDRKSPDVITCGTEPVLEKLVWGTSFQDLAVVGFFCCCFLM